MYCDNINDAFRNINEYFKGKCTGYPMLISTDNLDVCDEIRKRMVSDRRKRCHYVSDYCQKNGLPDIDACIRDISGEGKYVLIGLSRALMLKSEDDLSKKIFYLCNHSIRGHALIILFRCGKYINNFIRRDSRASRNVIIIPGTESLLPKICILKPELPKTNFLEKDLQGLLSYLERLTDEQIDNHKSITVRTNFQKTFFSQSMYQITEDGSIYDSIKNRDNTIALATKRNYGKEEQWRWLNEKLYGDKSFLACLNEEFGKVDFFETIIQSLERNKHPYKYWLCWLAMKAFGVNDTYLKIVINNSNSEIDFEEHVYLDFVDVDVDNPNFISLYEKRKKFLSYMPENLPLVDKYCESLGKRGKDAVYYLTDSSEQEKVEFISCLCTYDYNANELKNILRRFSDDLYAYMDEFVFDNKNTKLSEVNSDLHTTLTRYFQLYKMQKITNRVYTDFKDEVNMLAVSRPYNKLLSRSSIIKKIDRENADLFFFDALGVEFLSYIKHKCVEYGLAIEILVGRCELPSITEKNKEFIGYFGGRCKKINGLDEIKHHSQTYDYEKVKEPIHVFKELEIIVDELRRIHSALMQETITKAVIVSDHGASRLAVVYGQEAASLPALEEKGEHSGRCCETKVNPELPYVAYEDGFAVLANYERFRGGRRANVEVHGGATLEEVLVPIIIIKRKPKDIQYSFTNEVIILRQKDIAKITLYCNVSMKNPSICVERKFYEGEFLVDKKHAVFEMADLKRSGEYEAEIFDDDVSMSVCLKFKIKKSMAEENDLFA